MSDAIIEIVRLEKRPKFGLHHWTLFGLNILEYNKVTCPIKAQPDVVFLTDLTARLSCSVHVSSLALKDRANSPEEMFGPPDGATPYVRTRIGFHDIFYDLNAWPCFDACFFPRVTPDFWLSLLREEDDLEQMLANHAFAFYVSPGSEADLAMAKLLAAPFPGEAVWLEAATDLYSLVVAVGHDGQFFHIYARGPESLRLIEPSLSAASVVIKSSEWFQSHRKELEWDDLNCCLTLPEYRHNL